MLNMLRGFYAKLNKVFLQIRRMLDRFFQLENWPYWGLAIIIGILLVLLVLWIRKRRRKKAAEAPAQDAIPEEAPPAERISPGSLVRAWKEFLRGIPNEFRRSIMLYQPFIVMGEAGAGKSLLINHYTDWQGQSRQFYPSYTNSPLIQFYLGSKILVQEIPAALLNDTSREARSALLNLWKPLFKKRSPKVIVTLNGETLLSESSGSLKKQAQMMRGKINLLSFKRNRPPQVYVVLTFMNHVEGCSDFFDFLIENHIPLRIRLDTEADINDLRNCLEPYEEYLSRALVTLPAEKYLRILTFLRKAPEMFAALEEFIRILQRPDPLSDAPDVTYLGLTSDREKDSALSNPFRVGLAEREVRKYNPHLKHQIAAATLLLAGIAFFWGAYAHERERLSETEMRLAAIEENPPTEYNEEVRRLLQEFLAESDDNALAVLLPDFFPDTNQKIKERLLRDIREFYLIPRLRRVSSEENSYEKTLYLLSLIYGSSQNRLGDLVLANLGTWASLLDMPTMLLEDYIRETDTAWNEAVRVGNLEPGQADAVSADPQPWLLLFNEIEEAIARPFITEAYFQTLQERAESLLTVSEQFDRRDLLSRITNLLIQETPLDIKRPWIGEVRHLQLKQPPIVDFITYFLQKRIAYPAVDNLSLNQLLKNVNVMMSLKGEEPATYTFYISGRDFTFQTREIDALVTRSRITLFLRDFAEVNSQSEGLIFFRPDSEYPDIILSSGNSGLMFFTGNAEVDGRFTRRAFDEDVRPPLLELPEMLKRIPIDENEKNRFSGFVIRGVESYAAQYVWEYRNYYSAFGMEAEFPRALHYILNQIQLPSSRFQQLLLTIKENTALNLEENAFLRPLAIELRVFDPFDRLLREEKGSYPELEKYKAIMGQLQAELESNQVVEAEGETDEALALKKRLSTLGRISLSIFRNEENSYLNITRRWLNGVGITSEWDYLFLEPVLKTFDLGLEELAATVDGIWKKLQVSAVRPLRQNFPFNLRSEEITDPAWLEGTIHPEGALWRTFRELLAPVVEKTDEGWRRRTNTVGEIPLPAGMLQTVNEIEKITRLLWNDKGEPSPITLSIRPDLLSPVDNSGTIPVLSYLKAGDSAVYAFNQQPKWQMFEIEWWKSEVAAVGLELARPNEPVKAYRNLTVPEAPWSFYRLLRKAKSVDKKRVLWEIPGLQQESRILVVQFSMEEDPWRIFAFMDNERTASAN